MEIAFARHKCLTIGPLIVTDRDFLFFKIPAVDTFSFFFIG